MARRGNPVGRVGVRAVAAALGIALVACGEGGRARDLVEYHDPGGIFAVSLPTASEFTVATPSSDSPESPGLLAGVLAAPGQTQTPAIGGGLAIGQGAGDRTSFQVLVVSAAGFESLDDMVTFFLAAQAGFDTRVREDVEVDGDRGRLIVSDVLRAGAPYAGLAAVFSLGHDGVGSVIATVFPPGDWGAERDGFLAIVRSFRTDVSPAETALPVGVPTAA